MLGRVVFFGFALSFFGSSPSNEFCLRLRFISTSAIFWEINFDSRVNFDFGVNFDCCFVGGLFDLEALDTIPFRPQVPSLFFPKWMIVWSWEVMTCVGKLDHFDMQRHWPDQTRSEQVKIIISRILIWTVSRGYWSELIWSKSMLV